MILTELVHPSSDPDDLPTTIQDHLLAFDGWARTHRPRLATARESQAGPKVGNEGRCTWPETPVETTTEKPSTTTSTSRPSNHRRLAGRISLGLRKVSLQSTVTTSRRWRQGPVFGKISRCEEKKGVGKRTWKTLDGDGAHTMPIQAYLIQEARCLLLIME
jgi:hypothetical protein